MKQPPDLPQALHCINRAIALAPNAPVMQGMRGRILVALGQFEPGLKDLQVALKVSPKDAALHSAAAQACFALRMPDIAEEHLLQAAQVDPTVYVELSRFHSNRGELKKAEDELNLAAVWYAEQLKKNPENKLFRIKLAEIAVIQQDYHSAIALLEEGLQQTNPAVFREALGQVYQAWGASLPGGNQATSARLAHMRQALRYNPTLRGPVVDILRISQSNSPQADAAADLLAVWAQDPATAGVTNGVLGASAWSRGDKEEGRRRLELAFRFDQEQSDLCNNLAWALAHTEPQDLPRAEQLAKKALVAVPQQPSYHGTYGAILFHQQRWEEAVPHLKFALNANPKDQDLIRMLSESQKKLPAETAAP